MLEFYSKYSGIILCNYSLARANRLQVFVGNFPCPSLNPCYIHARARKLHVWMDDFFFPHTQNSTRYPEPCHQALQPGKVKRMKSWDQRAKCQSLIQVIQAVIIHCSGCTPALYPAKLFSMIWSDFSQKHLLLPRRDVDSSSASSLSLMTLILISCL